MFQIVKFQKDLVSGKTEVKVFFQLRQTSDIKEDGGTFSNEQAAKNWLRTIKKDYILIKIENYICHKKQIIDHAPHLHKSMIPKEQALAECLRYLQYVAEKQDLRETCKWALVVQSKLEMILPNPKNPSYENSKKDLVQIIEFAKEHAQGAILKEAC